MRLQGTAAFVLVFTAMPASAQIAGSMRGLSGSSRPDIRGDLRHPVPGDPALAQGISVSRETRGIRNTIEAGQEAGQLSRREARALRRESYRIQSMSARLAEGGYTVAEIALLRGRTEALRSAIVTKRTQGMQK